MEPLSSADIVLILGFGREGQSTYHYLHQLNPRLKIHLADQNPDTSPPEDFSGQTWFGPDYLDSLKIPGITVVVKSPGISPHLPAVTQALTNPRIKFTSHTALFFSACPGRIFGVSGTKGKSTTAALLCHVLTSCGLDTVLVGNIGLPALDFLPQIKPSTQVVMELSSYQLMDLTVSPPYAILQNIYSDHLDYHQDFQEYARAKSHLYRFQSPSDHLYFNADNPAIAELFKQVPPASLLHPYKLTDFPSSQTTKLLGDHNKYNILPSLLIAEDLHLPPGQVNAAISSFSPLETRLELVGAFRHVRYYADTLATIPEATIAAIDALGLEVNTLIAGGHDRHQQYANLATKIINSGINTLILFPATGPRLWAEVQKAARKLDTTTPQYFPASSMAEAVSLAAAHTSSGKICLLSPAAPSFTLFRDYKDEFIQFRTQVLALK